MAELSPMLKAMKAEPDRLWLTEELQEYATDPRAYRTLQQFAVRGLVERVSAPRPGAPRGVAWRYLRDPKHARVGKTLNPALPNTTQGAIMQVFEANPDMWLTNRDVATTCPARAKHKLDYSDLVKRGYLERRIGAEGYAEYRLIRIVPVGGSQPHQKPASPAPRKSCPLGKRPARVCVSPPKVAKAPTPKPPKPAKPARRPDYAEQARREEAKVAQQEAARAAHFAKTHAMRTAAQQQIVAYLNGKPEPETANQIKEALGLTLGVQKVAIVALMHAGVVAEIPGPTVTYRLLKPEFPEVPAAMNRAADRIYGLLLGRADTELGLMQLTGWQRPEVRAALARLDACGRLEWSGVGHLLIYRVREVAAQAAD